MKNITVTFLCFLCCIALLVSCSPKPEKTLIGKWQEVNGREAIEFLKDGSYQGSFIWDLTNAPIAVSGTFMVNGDKVDLTVEKPPDLTQMSWKITFAGSDELTIVFQQGGALKRDGNSAKYQRVK